MTNLQHYISQIGGQETKVFSLENNKGIRLLLSNYGARMLSLEVPNKAGKATDVLLGYGSLEEHIQQLPYYGAIIGRCANRIANAQFNLLGKNHALSANIAPHHLHGGFNSFAHKLWQPISANKQQLSLHYLSPHLEEGYPGNLNCELSFQLTNENELIVEMQAQSDRDTIVNLSTHPFFNLEGESYPQILSHRLKINADAYLALDADMIVDKPIALTADTIFDFRDYKTIGKDLEQAHPQLLLAKGYDHNYILNTKSPKEVAASVIAPASGIKMELYTNQPGLQLYTANWLDGSDIGKSGKAYHKHAAFCLEPQHFPNSPNRPDFPSILLKKDDIYYHYTKFHFSNI